MMKTTNLLKWVLAMMIGLCLIPASAFASNGPNWTIDTHEFEFDMSMYVSIQRNGVVMGNPSDLTLAAFVGEECRGLANLMYVSGTPYFYLRVRSHVQNGETVSFRCYDASRGAVDSVMATVQFENLKQFGFPSVPYVMSLFIPVTNISLNEDVLHMLVDQLDTLFATVLPLNASNKAVTWSTSDASVAQVNKGVVTALGSGLATITAQTNDGGWTASCQVYVKSYYQVTVHYSTHGYVSSGSTYFTDGENVRVLEDSVMVFKLTSDKSSEVGSLLYNGVDVTSQIQVVDGNSYFTTPPITQNSSLSVQFQLLKFELTIKDAESGSIGILVEPYQKQVISIHSSVDWELYSVLMNDVEVLGEVIMDTYTTPALSAPSTLQIIMKKIVPINLARAESPVQLKGSDGMITVKGVVLGERIRVYDLEGRLVKTTRVTGVETTLKLNPGAVHIIKIGSDTFKVAI